MPSKTHKQKIAIIEDDLPIAHLYQLKLQNAGFDTVVAYNGKQGLEIIEKNRPDLVLLDIRMPIMTGDDMLEQLRATNWGGGIRVIILTNISKDEAPSKLRLLSVDRYIVKAHYTPGQVLAVVDEVLGTSHIDA